MAAQHPDLVRRVAAIMKEAHLPSGVFPDFEQPAKTRPAAADTTSDGERR